MKKRNKKLLLFVTTMTVFTLSTKAYAQTKPADVPYLPPSTVQNVAISKPGEYMVVPFADITGWRYKAVEGKMYRRQYNYSRQNWIGEWEIC